MSLFASVWKVDFVSGHKNYCYQRHLAEVAPFDSFRFDFRGNGESGRSIHAPRTLKVSSHPVRFASCIDND
jgi:hypothetical protein